LVSLEIDREKISYELRLMRVTIRMMFRRLGRITRPFGLRWARLAQFKRVLELEMQATGMFSVVCRIGQGVLGMIADRQHRPSTREIKERYRTCLNCTINTRKWNPKTRKYEGLPRCRNGIAGCGCLIPYKLLQSDRCWGWDHGLGWPDSESLVTHKRLERIKKED